MGRDVTFIFTAEQQQAVAYYLSKSLDNLDNMQDHEICEMLDEFIDEVTA